MIIKLVDIPDQSPNIAASLLILENGEIWACEKQMHTLTKILKKIIMANEIILEKTEFI